MGEVLKETQFLMKKYNINALKSLGQNFLVDDDAINNIVESSEISKNDLVIEIGPGLGTLTKELLDRAYKVICIELDDRMIKILNERFYLYNNLQIINEDVLKIDLNNLIEGEKAKAKASENVKIENVKIVANLPYYITTPIIMKLLEDRLDIDTITVMIQKEVADRIIAVPGSKLSGAITYSVNYYAESEAVRFVSRDSFVPAPNVDSEVIKLKIRNKPNVEVENEKLFFDIIKYSFMQRRKTLVNALVNGKIMENKEIAKKCLEDLNIADNIRGEVLKIEDFAKIANYINNKK